MTENSIFEPAGRAVPYIDEGGDGPALVLIPGRGLDGGALGTVAHVLVEEGFRVLRVGSRPTSDEGPPSTSERADDAAAVMEHVGLAAAWVGGHGSGGTVARALVAERADRALGLLLLGVEEAEIALAPALPVLVIQGAEDETTPPANGERLRSAAADRVSVVSIDGAGHLFPATHPIETAEVIEDYLDWD